MQHPAVRVEAIALRASVAGATLAAEIVLRNDGPAAVNVSVAAALSSWNGAPWTYPEIPSLPPIAVPARGLSAPVPLSVPWLAPPASYWWPNRPWNASYVTQLHWLNVSLVVAVAPGSSAGAVVAMAAQRFGFVEHAEGPYYYTINGVRVNQLSDGKGTYSMVEQSRRPKRITFGLATSPFLRSDARDGDELLRRVHERGVCARTCSRGDVGALHARRHDEQPHPPEHADAGHDGCRGRGGLSPQARVADQRLPGLRTVRPGPCLPAVRNRARQMVVRLHMWVVHPSCCSICFFAALMLCSRTHPSVAAYSVENESGDEVIPELIDAASQADPSRPLTTEGSGSGFFFNGTG